MTEAAPVGRWFPGALPPAFGAPQDILEQEKP
jgi:hypothetical protein